MKILQRWDGIRARPCREFMRKFHAYLVQKVIDDKVANIERQNRLQSAGLFKSSNNTSSTPWIEKLLQSGIDDNRKAMVDDVLAPYLITRQHLEYDAAFDMIVEWLDKCDSMRCLEPSWSCFENRIRYALHNAQQTNWQPLGIEKFKSKYPDVYKKLYAKG